MTSRSAVVEAIVEALEKAFGDARVFVCATPQFLEFPPGARYIEVIPGSQAEEGNTSAFGVGRYSFTVCAFQRLQVDRSGDAVQRLAQSTENLMAAVDLVDTSLLNNSLSGLLTEPIWPESAEAPEDSPIEGDGWAMQRRTYRCTFSYSFPDYR